MLHHSNGGKLCPLYIHVIYLTWLGENRVYVLSSSKSIYEGFLCLCHIPFYKVWHKLGYKPHRAILYIHVCVCVRARCHWCVCKLGFRLDAIFDLKKNIIFNKTSKIPLIHTGCYSTIMPQPFSFLSQFYYESNTWRWSSKRHHFDNSCI